MTTQSSPLRSAANLFKGSFAAFRHRPVLLVPLLINLLIYTAVVVYLRASVFGPLSFRLSLHFSIPLNPIDSQHLLQTALYIFLVFFAVTILLFGSNLMLLEMMQQLESDGKVSLFRAALQVFSFDLIRGIPIALVWALIWFVMEVIRMLMNMRVGKGRRGREVFLLSMAQMMGSFGTALNLGISLLEELVRLTLFLSLPAIAWENLGPFAALKKAYGVIKQHTVNFFTIYAGNGIVTLLMLTPVVILSFIPHALRGSESSSALPPWFWTGVILYEGYLWIFGMYFEQMTSGMLYLWHLKWVKQGSKGDISSVEMPDLLDHLYELA